MAEIISFFRRDDLPQFHLYFFRFPDVDALAAAGVSEIEEIVRPCGLGKSKAKDISACMKMLKEQYGGKVPDDFDALLKLPSLLFSVP